MKIKFIDTLKTSLIDHKKITEFFVSIKKILIFVEKNTQLINQEKIIDEKDKIFKFIPLSGIFFFLKPNTLDSYISILLFLNMLSIKSCIYV